MCYEGEMNDRGNANVTTTTTNSRAEARKAVRQVDWWEEAAHGQDHSDASRDRCVSRAVSWWW